MAISKMLCAVDFSECSRGALRAALTLKRQSGASLDVVHVYEIPYPVQPALLVWMPDGPRAITEAVAQNFTEKLTEFIGSEGAQREVTAHVLSDHPADGIVAFAEKQRHDLIVVGTHGRTGLSRLLLGSVAARVIQHAPCPVLVIPESNRAESAPSGKTG